MAIESRIWRASRERMGAPNGRVDRHDQYNSDWNKRKEQIAREFQLDSRVEDKQAQEQMAVVLVHEIAAD